MASDHTYTAPRQPPANASTNPFESSFEVLPPASSSSGGGKVRNPFSVYEDGVDEDGTENGNWESEPIGIRGEGKFWQPKYYSMYFDINVSDFLIRMLRSILPFKPLLGWSTPTTIDIQEQEQDRSEEIFGGGGESENEDNETTSIPDLYGPIWITTTLVLTLSMGSKIAEFLLNVFQQKETSSLKPSLSTLELSKLLHASTIVYAYVFVFPLLLIVFQCLFVRQQQTGGGSQHAGNNNGNGNSNNQSMNVIKTYPIVGSVMVYGYSMTPVVVASFVTTVPVESVQMSAMGVAFIIGAIVIMLNLWRDISVEYRSLTYFVRLVAVLAHIGVGFALVFIFFNK